ncbi:hypothetical protein WJX81_003921 [Elliptochloris bilobata]|uniref:BZIP domain-containing protein n=1 Tax=Elliptochloris bilobata TaxID=381761 RepID=A0AAW1SH93_9CHLO
MVPPHCYHDTLVMEVKEPLDPVNRLLEDLMATTRSGAAGEPAEHASAPRVGRNAHSAGSSGRSDRCNGSSLKQSVREQNRRAAARFRQRQKDKLQEYEKQVNDLKAKLEKMNREKTAVESQLQRSTSHEPLCLPEKVDDAEAEAAKRETLGAALAAFVAAVRRDRSPSGEGSAMPSTAELLGPEGKLGLSHIMPVYKECAAELARCLANGGEEPGTAAHERVLEIIGARRNLFHKMGWLDAPLFRMVASLRYANSAGTPTNPGPDHWRKVLAATAYTKEQKEGLLAAREALFRRMHQILEQRERLVATLQAGFPSTDTEHANAPLYVAACAAADQLKGNLDGEFVAVRDFIAAFCRCMDYVQHARMLVVGYPFTPDVLAITNLVREEEGGSVCTQSALLMQQLPKASPFRTLSAAGAFA